MKLHTIPISYEAAHARGFDLVWIHRDHNHKIARALFAKYPHARTVEITRPDWNSGVIRYDKLVVKGTVLYVRSWNGKRARVFASPVAMEAA